MPEALFHLQGTQYRVGAQKNVARKEGGRGARAGSLLVLVCKLG